VEGSGSGRTDRVSSAAAPMSEPSVATRLPVGFERFHGSAFPNYQLDRAHALGFADRDELRAAAS